MEFITGFIIGVLTGAGIVLAVGYIRGRASQAQLRETFAALAGEALDANSRRLAEQAGAALDGKKALIDQTLKAIDQRLEQVRQYVARVEVDRKEDFGKLSTSVGALATTTGELHKMLASTQRRGAWGERMADDILRLAGLQEGVNYRKQFTEGADTGRPDFTFFLPNELVVNMDVKFPLESYKTYVDAADDAARAVALQQLVKAVRGHIDAVARRGYIDPKGGTVPYVLLFIPSEQIYSLVLDAQPDLMDEALGKKIVLAGPMTLYAMLAVICQAAESANVAKTADEISSLLGEFYKQWQSYWEQEDKVLQRFRQASDEFGSLVSTRRNMLQRPLDKIENLRSQRGLKEKQE